MFTLTEELKILEKLKVFIQKIYNQKWNEKSNKYYGWLNKCATYMSASAYMCFENGC